MYENNVYKFRAFLFYFCSLRFCFWRVQSERARLQQCRPFARSSSSSCTNGSTPLPTNTIPSCRTKTSKVGVGTRTCTCCLIRYVACILKLSDFSTFGLRRVESQTTQFEDFLLRANKYPTLQIFQHEQLQRKVILVEVLVARLYVHDVLPWNTVSCTFVLFCIF